MPERERLSLHHPRQLVEQKLQERNEHIIHSRLLTPPPLSPQGYTLQLIKNIPSQLTPEESAEAERKIDRDRLKLAKEGAFNPPKVNIVDLQIVTKTNEVGQTEQTIQYVTAPSYYFQHRSGIDNTTPTETARKLSHSGASLVAITGDNMIVLSSRPDKVQLYPRTFAATASGSWDGVIQPQEPGKPEMLVPPTPDNAIAHIKKELHEETGLPMAIIDSPDTQLTITGVAEDQIKKHRDILYMMRLPKNITSADMRMFHKEEKTNGNTHSDNDPMAAHLIFLPANPSVIARLLIESHAPWDATARSTLLMTGYMLRMQQALDKGVPQEAAAKKAKRWLQFTEWFMALNQSINIDHLTRKSRAKKIRRAWRHYAAATIGALLRKPGAELQARIAMYDIEKYRKRPRRYDVHRVPARQDLPEVRDELRRLGFDEEGKLPELSERKRRHALIQAILQTNHQTDQTK